MPFLLLGRSCPLQTILLSDLIGSDSPLLTIMVRQKAITICRGQERPKGRKGTLRPDFQANARPRFFFKSHCHHKMQEGGCEEI